MQASPEDHVASGWSEVACPLCGSFDQEIVLNGESKFFGTHGRTSIKKCKCGMLLTNPQPHGAALSAFYSTATYYTHVTPGLVRRLRGRLSRSFQRWQLRGPLMNGRLLVERRSNFKRWAKRLVPDVFTFDRGSRFLDFGCGHGLFLRIVAGMGLNAIGVEPDEKARQVALGNHAKVASTLQEADTLAMAAGNGVEPPKYDRIFLRHVLEHLPEPAETLRELCKRLAPGGMIFISVPNAQARQAEAFKEFWLGYDLPRHLWHFTGDSLCRLLESVGVKIISMSTVELPVFSKLSRHQMIEETGKAPTYEVADFNALEAAGLGTEVVVVGRLAD